MSRRTGTLRIISRGKPEDEIERMSRDVRAGLTTTPKDLSPWPKYLYDEEGSRLFEEITAQPEYYQTRAELSILREKAVEIAARTRCRDLVELGSGSATKTRALLDAMFEVRGTDDGPVRYAPLDVSESALRQSSNALLREYPELEIWGFVGDFAESLGHPLRNPDIGSRLVIFLGGTIGNFTSERRQDFLSELRAGLRSGDHLLIGVDLVKDTQALERAYNDRAGITARFNKNLLKVLNYRLGAHFDPSLFSHRAIYNAGEARIEMWLDSKSEQRVYVSGLDLEIPLEAGEGIRTEISVKFTLESTASMFAETGLELRDLYTDEEGHFGLALVRAGG